MTNQNKTVLKKTKVGNENKIEIISKDKIVFVTVECHFAFIPQKSTSNFKFKPNMYSYCPSFITILISI